MMELFVLPTCALGSFNHVRLSAHESLQNQSSTANVSPPPIRPCILGYRREIFFFGENREKSGVVPHECVILMPNLHPPHLFLFPLSPARFRLLCQSIIAHKLFDYVVLAFIFLNCITVALERPKILQGSLVRICFPISFNIP